MRGNLLTGEPLILSLLPESSPENVANIAPLLHDPASCSVS